MRAHTLCAVLMFCSIMQATERLSAELVEAMKAYAEIQNQLTAEETAITRLSGEINELGWAGRKVEHWTSPETYYQEAAIMKAKADDADRKRAESYLNYFLPWRMSSSSIPHLQSFLNQRSIELREQSKAKIKQGDDMALMQEKWVSIDKKRTTKLRLREKNIVLLKQLTDSLKRAENNYLKAQKNLGLQATNEADELLKHMENFQKDM